MHEFVGIVIVKSFHVRIFIDQVFVTSVELQLLEQEECKPVTHYRYMQLYL